MIDSHFHLWRRREAKQAGVLAAPYLQRDIPWRAYAAATRGLPLEGCVAVQVNDFVDGLVEARYLAGVARRHPQLKAIVAWAQLEAAGAERQLTRLATLPLVAGVRRSTQFEADPGVAGSAAYAAGASRLAARRWVCEVCVKWFQLESVVRLAEACPRVTVVLDHLGKPDLSRADQSDWRRSMTRLGRLRNVVCKVSVVVHTEHDQRLDRRRVEPIVSHVVEAFGFDRVLFGSNWPVATAVIDYREWVELVNDLLAGVRARDRDRLFGANARRVYRLPA